MACNPSRTRIEARQRGSFLNARFGLTIDHTVPMIRVLTAMPMLRHPKRLHTSEPNRSRHPERPRITHEMKGRLRKRVQVGEEGPIGLVSDVADPESEVE